MTQRVRRIVVVGGGTAGWLAACRIAAAADPNADTPLSVTLVESPDVATIGVGEGTWPTMRGTLARIGIDEATFLRAADASFKQGSRFDGWRSGAPDDRYYHPFTAPADLPAADLVRAWQDGRFAEQVCAQPAVCAEDLAPRQPAMPPYAGALNYGYHLDAGKFAALLRATACNRLGVTHVRDHVTAVEAAENGDIAAVVTRQAGRIAGDLFLDCTGHAALLIGGHYGVETIDRTPILFNDRALAVQVPVASDSPIASQTNATAHDAGWIWDIGLPSRRGIGCVYASDFLSDDAAAAALRDYLSRTAPGVDPDSLSFRQLRFRSAHRERFWQGNCVAIGLSAGFLEPLEASAIVLIELSIDALLDGFPAERGAMPLLARRFNALFRYRWDRIVDFLKVHYVLSERDTPYWRAHRDPGSWTGSLHDQLELWRTQPPSPADFAQANEIFPAASHQYVLYGMGMTPPPPGPLRADPGAAAALHQVRQRARTLGASLPTNRAYLRALAPPAGIAHV
ncbi:MULTISPECIES: tryptophan halogenase family protein [unclassified Sphingomonas]|uniref:tryptophan halogenase family protein n=1 Tax=unclassified Sphingomonas TaxID=196159 RepID=UPI0006F47A57|nr:MULTISPECIES: tryptophan halogenase family protein [unclassified Sphingomonas]KQM66649.1 tryptophan halogenase [Sphingomonas sp. Leaf16]KQN17598.1 tryptophan halogenase [Sphingomonas sp. Leaf29]KQN23462.1 tryptophan halogenase [Sphingomonas sp. Leaf32]